MLFGVLFLSLLFPVISRRHTIFCFIHTATPSHETRVQLLLNLKLFTGNNNLPYLGPTVRRFPFLYEFSHEI